LTFGRGCSSGAFWHRPEYVELTCLSDRPPMRRTIIICLLLATTLLAAQNASLPRYRVVKGYPPRDVPGCGSGLQVSDSRSADGYAARWRVVHPMGAMKTNAENAEKVPNSQFQVPVASTMSVKRYYQNPRNGYARFIPSHPCRRPLNPAPTLHPRPAARMGHPRLRSHHKQAIVFIARQRVGHPPGSDPAK
jgi:hypothetical protein